MRSCRHWLRLFVNCVKIIFSCVAYQYVRKPIDIKLNMREILQVPFMIFLCLLLQGIASEPLRGSKTIGYKQKTNLLCSEYGCVSPKMNVIWKLVPYYTPRRSYHPYILEDFEYNPLDSNNVDLIPSEIRCILGDCRWVSFQFVF